MDKLNFPKNFLFGSATSAHQVEGGLNNDWTHWEKKAGKIFDGSTSKIAADSWNCWSKDIQLLKNSSQNAYRFSIEWSQIEPQEGEFDIAAIKHYRQMIDELVKNDITPMATLFHFTCPLWIDDAGGVAGKKFAPTFTRFAEKMAAEFGDKIKLWSLLNEPTVYVNAGYFQARWCPGKKNIIAGIRAFLNLISAQRKSYLAMKKADSTIKVGIAMNMTAFRPKNDSFCSRQLTRFFRWITNEFFINRVRNCLDFLGINFYSSYQVQCKKPFLSGKIADGLYQIVIENRHWNLPIYITENGLPDEDDVDRQKFIVDALSQLSRVIGDGTDLRGYFHWSLIDNFEWASGYSMKFGLHDINRHPRKSAEIYRKMILENRHR